MKVTTYRNEILEFQYPDTCQIVLKEGDDSGGAVEMAHLLGEERVARIFVRWHELSDGETPAYLANSHRQHLIRLGLKVADSSLLPAPVPERFEEALFYQPPVHQKRVRLDAPLVIYRKLGTLVSIGMIGPAEDVSKILWRGNQRAFEFVRETLNFLEVDVPSEVEAPGNLI